MKPSSSAPSFFEGIYRWAGNSLIATTHFLAVLVVAPFSRRMTYQIGAVWARRAMAWFGVEIKMRDPNNGNWGPPPYVFVNLNQNSLVEGGVFLQFLPLHRTIVNVEYAAIPFIGWAYVLLGSIVIVRQWKTQAKRGIERAIRLLKRGENIGISIEGRRSPDGRISRYKCPQDLKLAPNAHDRRQPDQDARDRHGEVDRQCVGITRSRVRHETVFARRCGRCRTHDDR